MARKKAIEMFSLHNKRKSAIAEWVIRTLNKMYEYMTSFSKDMYIDKLDNISRKYTTHTS